MKIFVRLWDVLSLREDDRDKIAEGVRIHRELDHVNVVRVFSVFEGCAPAGWEAGSEPAMCTLVMELGVRGDLCSWIGTCV